MKTRELLSRLYREITPLLHSRKQYRLFMSNSLQNISQRTRELAALTDYFANDIRTIPIMAPFGNSMLVLAPHQDDETIGCGGVMALQAKSGKELAVVILQDGADEHEATGHTIAELTNLRNAESRKAASIIGVENIICLNYRVLAQNYQDAVAAVRSEIQQRHSDAIFTPFLLEANVDHRLTAHILADALREISWPVRVFSYEVWGFTIPNVIVVIDSVIIQKQQMLQCFEYANSAVDYVHTTTGINMYRSRLLGAGQSRFAECFFEIPKAQFIDLVDTCRKMS